MSVSSLGGGDLSYALASLSTAQATQQADVAVAISALKQSMDAQNAILSLISSSLGVGQNLDVYA